MKRIIILMQLILIGIVAVGQELKTAPINPQYLEYLKNKDYEKQKNTKASTYPLGEIPPPIRPNFENFKSPIRTKAPLPVSYDLRLIENGKYLTPVKNQGEEGACWAFATYGALESYCKKMGLGEYDFSEQNMVTCHDFDNNPSEGGHYLMSSAYLSRYSGPISEADDPYTLPENRYCKEGFTPIAYSGDLRILPGKSDDGFDKDLVKQAIIDYGGLYMSFYFNDRYMNYTDNTFYYNGTGAVNHGVTIVGWDDNKVITGGRAATPSSPGAWIVKNSWGPEWGTEDGYFYISYEDNVALSNVGYFPYFIENKENATIYSYDKFGWVSSTGFENGSQGLIKYIAENDLKLKKIGTFIPNANTVVDIQIYSSFLDNQLFGLLGSISNLDCQLPGYYTFDLPTPIKIIKGNNFYIKINYKSEKNYSIPVEAKTEGYSSKAEIQTGKCWISSTGAQWQPIGKGTLPNTEWNLCIKAYAENIERRYVTQTGNGNGTSWENSSNDLQAMINTLKNTGGEVWVAEGIYTPARPADNLENNDYFNRNNAFVLLKDIKLYGSFKGGETLLSERPKLEGSNNEYSTILSGLLSAKDTAYHVVVAAGDVGEALIDRFTITEGNAAGYESIVVNDAEIVQSGGGGLYIINSSPILTDIKISGNSASFGGGLFIDSSKVNMENVYIENNSAIDGGGICNQNNSNIELTNSYVKDNVAIENGGGIFSPTTSGVFVNTLFAGNRANERGGAFFYEDGEATQPFFINCTFSKNDAGEGNVLFFKKNGEKNAPKFHNCIIDKGENISGDLVNGEGNFAGINDIIFKYTFTSYSNLGNNSENIENIIETDPHFVDAANNDYHLQSTSPALWVGDINVFNSNAIPNISSITEDPDGNERIMNGLIDIGMYQSTFPYVSIQKIEDDIIMKVYPNPTQGIINIDTDNNMNLEIKIYSLRGELLLKERGNRIDISGFASGIYIMQIGNQKIKIVKE